jgi:hypothetical protein
MDTQTVEVTGTWRRDRHGRWNVLIEADAVFNKLRGLNGSPMQVRVHKRHGGYDLVTVVGHGWPFTDKATGKEMIYAYPSARQAAS